MLHFSCDMAAGAGGQRRGAALIYLGTAFGCGMIIIGRLRHLKDRIVGGGKHGSPAIAGTSIRQ